MVAPNLLDICCFVRIAFCLFRVCWLMFICDFMFLLSSFSFADAVRVLLAPELAKERRWCYGTSSVISTIVVAHAAGRTAWPAGVYCAFETIH